MSTTVTPALSRASSGITDDHGDDKPVSLAVSYLRVSTREQAERGGTEEGFSIPAQREANYRKADELSARIVREFVDAGESARSADRDGLQEMLAFIAATRVQFCIVHKLDRLARNRADDVAIHQASSAPASSSSPRRNRSTRPRRGCSSTASCPPLPSSTVATSPPKSPWG